MGISSHRGKIQFKKDHMSNLPDELMAVFELAVDVDTAGYFLKRHGATTLPEPLTTDKNKYTDKDTYYAQYAVAYAAAAVERDVETGFGVTARWKNDTGAPAYLGIFKGYKHPLNDIPSGRIQLATYYVMVANKIKSDPEHAAESIPTTSVQLTIDLSDIAPPTETAALEVYFAPVTHGNHEHTTLKHIPPQGQKLVVAKIDGTFETGAYTIARPMPAQQTSAKLVNINTASRDALIDLPGIGPALADRIIAARPFNSIEDILRVDGIGSALLEQLRPRITV